MLYTDGPCSIFSDTLNIDLIINQTCPTGFSLSESLHSCVCSERLENYISKCEITNGLGKITCDSGKDFWIGYDDQSNGLILHPHCPFDYCAMI